jgi:hypothetical protein
MIALNIVKLFRNLKMQQLELPMEMPALPRITAHVKVSNTETQVFEISDIAHPLKREDIDMLYADLIKGFPKSIPLILIQNV